MLTNKQKHPTKCVNSDAGPKRVAVKVGNFGQFIWETAEDTHDFCPRVTARLNQVRKQRDVAIEFSVIG